jgi:cell filamentation protein
MENEKLEQAERMITGYKLANMYLNPGIQTFDVNHYLRIHKELFEDIYAFAGEIRGENIQKQIPFCVPNLIYENLKDTLEKARNWSNKITDEEGLIDFITYLYTELDVIHPFREGNGRTEREFLRQYVEKINEKIDFGHYCLDYDKIEDKNLFIKAVVIADATCDLTYLKEFIKQILTKKQKTK